MATDAQPQEKTASAAHPDPKKALKSKVAVIKTSPETVLDDYRELMHLAEYEKFLPKDVSTALKINISWQVFFPACSTTPWQLDGVIRTLLEDGYQKELIHGCHNSTVVVSAKEGEVANKHRQVVVDKYGLANVYLEDDEWIEYKPEGRIRVLYDIFPEGIFIPRRLIGENIIHLPTMKTHVFTTFTGAMKNAFGGLLSQKRHWTHSVIHETLVDLLVIQKEIHPGVFAVMDGAFAGDGPGPRAMRPSVRNYILASNDQVAIDAVAGKMMGFEPMSLDFIRLAHEAGLGCGVVDDIEIVGDDISEVNFGFVGDEDTFASRGQKMIYHGLLKPFEKLLLRTPIVPWSFWASRLYHDGFWYPFVGKRRVNEMLDTGWGRLFQQY